eukprot:SAG22_NODE_635_length_8370_cov_33.081127_2_plen_59_part_00
MADVEAVDEDLKELREFFANCELPDADIDDGEHRSTRAVRELETVAHHAARASELLRC